MTEPWTELLTKANRASRRVFGDRCLRGIDADDIAQRSVVRQWARGDTSSRHTYWDTYYESVQEARRAETRRPGHAWWVAESINDETPAPERDGPALSALRDALRSLPPEEHTVVMAWLGCAGNAASAARWVGMPRATYRRRWDQALAMLRVLLEGDDE